MKYLILKSIIVFFLFLFIPMQAMTNSPTQIAVIPFTVNAEKNYAYLQNGITETLIFHLSKEGESKIIDSESVNEVMKDMKGPLTDTKAAQIGQELKADYIVYGSVTVFGDQVNVHGKAFDVKKLHPPIRLSREMSSIDGIIPEIKVFAGEIEKAIVSATSHTNQPQDELEIQAEKKSNSSSAIIVHRESQVQGMTGFWRSEPVETLIHSLGVGDIDNDGKKEILILSPHTIDLYRIQQSKLVKEEKIYSDDGHYFISIDIADINGNGFPEIFVTSLNALQNTVSSFVLEYKQGVYIRTMKDLSWYFKVIEGKQLMGQNQRTGGSDIFSGAIVRMAWKNNRYEPAEPIMPEHSANLLGFACGRFLNTSESVAVVTTKGGSLQIIDSSGNRFWSGSESYATLPFYFILPREEPSVENRQYYPARIKINPTDGNKEIIVARNPKSIGGALLNFFSSNDQSQIEALYWDGIGFTSKWETRKISGTITDFIIDDVDQDGKNELVVSLILETGNILRQPKSVLFLYNLDGIKE
ncbi:MAG: FG-GAP-like repeat-containing protein [Pseudomonadota bacterium]